MMKRDGGVRSGKKCDRMRKVTFLLSLDFCIDNIHTALKELKLRKMFTMTMSLRKNNKKERKE